MTGKRKLQAERTRARIIEAMQELIREHGYENVTVDLIAEACSIGKGTLYHYFSSKDDIFTYIERTRFAESAAEIDEMVFDSAEEKLRFYVRDWFEKIYADSINISSTWYRFAIDHKLPSEDKTTHFDDDLANIERILADGVASGEFVKGTPCRALAETITFTINGGTYYRCITEQDFDFKAWSERYVDSMLGYVLEPFRA